MARTPIRGRLAEVEATRTRERLTLTWRYVSKRIWQEQYLLQALVSNNAQFRVLCAIHALSRLRQSQMSALTRAFRAEMVPSGFWFEKLSDGAG